MATAKAKKATTKSKTSVSSSKTKKTTKASSKSVKAKPAPKKKVVAPKKPTVKKAASTVKKSAAKKAVPKKNATKKADVKKAVAKKTPIKKVTVKNSVAKPAVKKASAKKTAAKKTTTAAKKSVKKTSSTKTTTKAKVTAKKSSVKKVAPKEKVSSASQKKVTKVSKKVIKVTKPVTAKLAFKETKEKPAKNVTAAIKTLPNNVSKSVHCDKPVATVRSIMAAKKTEVKTVKSDKPTKSVKRNNKPVVIKPEVKVKTETVTTVAGSKVNNKNKYQKKFGTYTIPAKPADTNRSACASTATDAEKNDRAAVSIADRITAKRKQALPDKDEQHQPTNKHIHKLPLVNEFVEDGEQHKDMQPKKQDDEWGPTIYGQDIGDNPVGMARALLWIVAAFVIVGLIWAKYAVLDEVTVATGKVIPSSKVQIVQNLEGGIISKIDVKEGDAVAKGQVLMEIDDKRFASSYGEGKFSVEKLQASVARLDAEVNKKKLVFPKSLITSASDVVDSEKALYLSRKEELNILKHQRDLIKKELDLTQPLVIDGAASEVEVLRLRQRLSEHDKAIIAFQSDTLKEYNKAKAELKKSEHKLVPVQDQLARTTVVSPVKGVVKQIYVNTVGGVVKPGMELVEVVPLDESLLIEAKVRPQDIGFIHADQKATVKITAYDYAIYGGLEGKVEHISADTSTDEDGVSYYEVWVRTTTGYLGDGDNKLKVIPGMQASVDILTGHKSVLDYILKPILRAKHKALTER